MPRSALQNDPRAQRQRLGGLTPTLPPHQLIALSVSQLQHLLGPSSSWHTTTYHTYQTNLRRGTLDPDEFHNYDVLDEGARISLVERGYYNVLGLPAWRKALAEAEGRDVGHYESIDDFLLAYDLLNEHDRLDVTLSADPSPGPGKAEQEWCSAARLSTRIGTSPLCAAFALSAARLYAYERARRFLDFSTSQAELLRLFRRRPDLLDTVRANVRHLVVDEVQDINPVQSAVIAQLVGDSGRLTCVGDHRQAIFGWRGGRVDIMGRLHDDLQASADGEVVDLEHNFRSTPRIIAVANRWALTIGSPGSMSAGDMRHGTDRRTDAEPSHVGFMAFDTREAEAAWIAGAIAELAQGDTGAYHDTHDGGQRGLRYSDIAILLRSSTDARTYMEALREAGVPALFRGSDLFAQPEALLFTAALARAAGIDRFYGATWKRSLPMYIGQALGCDPEPVAVIQAACRELRRRKLPLADDVEKRLMLLADLIHARVEGEPVQRRDVARLRTREAKVFLERQGAPRRVFPQGIFHLLLAEAGIDAWDALGTSGETAMFHVGALSRLVTGIETPGWTTPYDFRAQVIALCNWAPQSLRLPDDGLLASTNAVSIGTIHSAKGLEWPAVFVADVCARRFPSSRARQQVSLPFEGRLAKEIDAADLADNDNYDGERRLLYVALTRAERYLFVSCSGNQRSTFRRALEPIMEAEACAVNSPVADVPGSLIQVDAHDDSGDRRLISSFSDLRYYLECPHDFYLRKVLGFAPTIDQAFGYGRGVHNLMRAVHADPQHWAALAGDRDKLTAELERLVGRGLFYLRYTTGEPLERMRAKAVAITADYVQLYADELTRLTFEPEREFETLIEEENVLISGAIDVVRLDDPPRVTLLDFKSGEAESDLSMKLDEDEMRLQVSVYGLAARRELEYDPERGLVRYLDEEDPDRRQLSVDLDASTLSQARDTVVQVARDIKDRRFHVGPQRKPRHDGNSVRCQECDFDQFCGLRASASNGDPQV